MSGITALPEIFLDFSPFQENLNSRRELLNTAWQTKESPLSSLFCQKEQILYLIFLTVSREILRLELKIRELASVWLK